ncbi:hypothetical protein SH501x_004114 [Pirellulaceae bacterium SH501]
MMNIATWIIVSIVVLSNCATMAQDKETENSLGARSSKPGWSIEATASPKTPRLSDTITLQFTVESDPEFSLQAPELVVAPDEYTIRQPLEQISFSAGNRRVFQAIVAPSQTGVTLLPRLAIAYTRSSSSGNQDRSALQGIMASPSIQLEVLSNPDGSNIAAVRSSDIESLPEETNIWKAWSLPLLGLAGVSLLGFVVFAMRRWFFLNRHSKAETPEGMANRMLDRLLNEKLPEQGLFQEFYIRLTGIVREFIAKKTGLHAPELTTEEFWLAAQRSPRFSIEWSQTLRDFLVSADLVKFGGQRPDNIAMEQAISTARETIQRIANLPADNVGGG